MKKTQITELELYNYITIKKFEYTIHDDQTVIMELPLSDTCEFKNKIDSHVLIENIIEVQVEKKQILVNMIPICEHYNIEWKNIFTEIEL
jgi:hypothetical protein